MDFWGSTEVVYMVITGLTILIMLYAMSLMNRAIRVLQYDLSVMENEMKMMSEEFKMIANRERLDPAKISAHRLEDNNGT